MARKNCKSESGSKERLTFFLCANIAGSDKLQPLLIGKCSIHLVLHPSFMCTNICNLGKTAKPRCPKYFNFKEPPATWKPNRTSWMIVNLFDDWLHNANRSMIKQKRKILLFMDHVPCHHSDIEYSNISIEFFLANTI